MTYRNFRVMSHGQNFLFIGAFVKTFDKQFALDFMSLLLAIGTLSLVIRVFSAAVIFHKSELLNRKPEKTYCASLLPKGLLKF